MKHLLSAVLFVNFWHTTDVQFLQLTAGSGLHPAEWTSSNSLLTDIHSIDA